MSATGAIHDRCSVPCLRTNCVRHGMTALSAALDIDWDQFNDFPLGTRVPPVEISAQRRYLHQETVRKGYSPILAIMLPAAWTLPALAIR